MSRIRTVLAWLLLLAIPLQGIAAASMLYCGPAARAAVQLQQSSSAGHHHMQAADHGGRAGHTGHHAGKATDGALPDAGHKCGVCAACCHGAALTGTPLAVALSPAPQLAWNEPFVPVYSRPSPVPDKPPRA